MKTDGKTIDSGRLALFYIYVCNLLFRCASACIIMSISCFYNIQLDYQFQLYAVNEYGNEMDHEKAKVCLIKRRGRYCRSRQGGKGGIESTTNH